MAGKPEVNYPKPADALKAIERLGSAKAAAEYYGIKPTTFKDWIYRTVGKKALHEARDRHTETLVNPRGLPPAPELEVSPEAQTAQEVHGWLKKQKSGLSVSAYDIADALDIPPSRVRAALDLLREQGYRIQEGDDVSLNRVQPDIQERLHKSLLQGTNLKVGIVSDTHLCSKHEALAELNLAYRIFAEEEISEVWHSGDLVSGLGVYRTQHTEIKCHTYDDQVNYAAEFYPRQEGITTRIIAGNHDIEGSIGQIGGDPVQAVANMRDDIDYLGPYSAHIELPGGSYAHLLHGSGGMSYSYSYKAQKIVDGYDPGTKPAILSVGHWHVSGCFDQRNVNVLFPACFEWQSHFLKRKGLSPSVGFWIVEMTIGDDGSIVRFKPEFSKFYPGRVTKHNIEAVKR